MMFALHDSCHRSGGKNSVFFTEKGRLMRHIGASTKKFARL
jgi:hypothetical protein